MNPPTAKAWFTAFIAINIIGFWAFAIFYFFRQAPVSAKLNDEAGILLGSATLVLTVLTIFLGILAAVGWHDIRNQVLRVADERVKALNDNTIQPLLNKRQEEANQSIAKGMKDAEEQIAKGMKDAEERFSDRLEVRLSAITGASHLQLFQVLKDNLSPTEILDTAISLNQQALKGLTKDDERWSPVVNNLALCYALRRRGEDAEEAIRLAEDLAKENRERQDPDFTDTWARVLIEYQEYLEDRDKKLGAVKAVLQKTVEDGSKIYREDAIKHLQRLKELAPNLP